MGAHVFLSDSRVNYDGSFFTDIISAGNKGPFCVLQTEVYLLFLCAHLQKNHHRSQYFSCSGLLLRGSVATRNLKLPLQNFPTQLFLTSSVAWPAGLGMLKLIQNEEK